MNITKHIFGLVAFGFIGFFRVLQAENCCDQQREWMPDVGLSSMDTPPASCRCKDDCNCEGTKNGECRCETDHLYI